MHIGLRYALLAIGLAPVVSLGQLLPSTAAESAQSVKMFRLDTHSIVPQIDDKYRPHPIRPENPMFRTQVVPARPNGLALGGLLEEERGQVLGLFPAIGGTGWIPADCDLAVGQNHIVGVVNSSIAFFDKTGVKSFQQTSTTFFSGLGAGTFQFDPKVIYDRTNNRFVAIFLEQATSPQTSKILLAISDDGDPNGTWYRYRIESKLKVGNKNYWLDYPGFGGNGSGYVVSGNMFPFSGSGFAGVRFLVVRASSILSGGSAVVTSLRDSAGASAQMADMVSSGVTNVVGVSRSSTTTLKVYSVNNVGATPTLSSTSVTVPSNSSPSRDANSTSGRVLDTLDGRVFNACVRGGQLVTTHNAQSGNIQCRWYQVNLGTWPTSGAPALVQSGAVSSTTSDYHMPAVNINASNSISMIFNRSSSTITADLMYTGRKTTDTAGFMGAPTLLENSAGTNYAQGRWGDYFGCEVDPVDNNTFWGMGMTVDAANNWRTSIFSWIIP